MALANADGAGNESDKSGKLIEDGSLGLPGRRRSSPSITDGVVVVGQQDAYVPDDNLDEFVDPRVKDYPVPLVAKTVGLHNDPT